MDGSLNPLPLEPSDVPAPPNTPKAIGREAARTGSATGVVGARLDRKPVDSPHEGRWIAKPRKARWVLEMGGWGILFGLAPGVVSMIAEIVLGKEAGPVARWTLIALFTALCVYLAVRDALAHRVLPQDKALLDGGFGDQFPVEATIVAGGRRIGTDRGLLWCADGLIGFSGKASSFVLAPQDVKAYPGTTRAKGKTPAREAGTIRLVGSPIGAHLLVRALGKHNKAYLRRLEQFEKDTADPDAERFWPPLEPYGVPFPLPIREVRS